MTHECSRLVFRNLHFEFSWNLNFVIWDFKLYHHKILRGYNLFVCLVDNNLIPLFILEF
jgi:hypothetical protein